MKNLRRTAIGLTLLAGASFFIALTLSAVTVVPWRESWRNQLVTRWNVASLVFLGAAAIAWIVVVIARARARAI